MSCPWNSRPGRSETFDGPLYLPDDVRNSESARPRVPESARPPPPTLTPAPESHREVRRVSSDREMTDVPRTSRRSDHEVTDHGLTMQVLANQVNELSGLVRQVLDDPGRERGHRRRSRSDSRRGRSRSRRARSSARRGRSIPPPRTPPTPPRRTSPPSSSVPQTSYPEDQRHELEQLPYRHLHDEDHKPLCWNPEEYLLTLLTKSVRGWTNRDRTLWLCDPALTQSEQQQKGIRVDVRIRSRTQGLLGSQVDEPSRTVAGSSQFSTGFELTKASGTASNGRSQ